MPQHPVPQQQLGPGQGGPGGVRMGGPNQPQMMSNMGQQNMQMVRVRVCHLIFMRGSTIVLTASLLLPIQPGMGQVGPGGQGSQLQQRLLANRGMPGPNQMMGNMPARPMGMNQVRLLI